MKTDFNRLGVIILSGMIILLLLIWILGCTRHYHVWILGNNNEIEVVTNVPKEVSLEGKADVSVIPK